MCVWVLYMLFAPFYTFREKNRKIQCWPTLQDIYFNSFGSDKSLTFDQTLMRTLFGNVCDVWAYGLSRTKLRQNAFFEIEGNCRFLARAALCCTRIFWFGLINLFPLPQK